MASEWKIHPVLGWMVLGLAIIFLSLLIGVHFYNKRKRNADETYSEITNDDEYTYYSEQSSHINSSVYYSESDANASVNQGHSNVTKGTMSNSSIGHPP